MNSAGGNRPFFAASEAVERENRVLFSKAIFQTMLPGMASPSFNSYEELFSYIDSICMTESLIISLSRSQLAGRPDVPFLVSLCRSEYQRNCPWNGEAIYFQQVKPQLNHYMGLAFENICRQYLFLPEQIAAAPFLYSKVGRWWGNNPVEKNRRK